MEKQATSKSTSSQQQSLTAGGRPVVNAPTVADYRRQKFEQAQKRLRQRYERGLPIPRIR